VTKLIKQFDLAGKTALVTGGGSGIGLSLSQILAEAGAKVMIASRNVERLRESARLIGEAAGTQVHYAEVDLEDRQDAQRLIEHAQSVLGGIDILVCNAGMEIMEFVDQIKDESYNRIVSVNLTSNVAMTRAVVPAMKAKQWGRIIYVTSTTAIIASKHVGHSVYTATKAGLEGFARVAAVELAMDGITVNCLSPGITMTDMIQATISEMGLNEQQRDEFINYNGAVTAVNRWARPEEMSGPLLLLASDAGSYITGATYVVDGGQTVVMDPVVKLQGNSDDQ
jgi:NAD(P)-dependent dehydrogenase (short-subunit alcohol dehydrogenase family)